VSRSASRDVYRGGSKPRLPDDLAWGWISLRAHGLTGRLRLNRVVHARARAPMTKERK
jgi:hypothetical protein